MIRVLAIALTVATLALPAAHQSRTPSFLAGDDDAVKLDTLHLQARVEGDVRVDADGRGVVMLAVTPKPKMHVYAADAKGYVPFTLRVEPETVVVPGRIVYPAAEVLVLPPGGETSRVYRKPFKVTQAFVLTPDGRKRLTGSGRVSAVAQIRYQACDDAVCYRPATGTVSFDIVR